MPPKKNQKPKEPLSNKLSNAFTTIMATWKFAFIILLACIVEMYGNHVGWFHFDPTMLGLNTILSLWAAIQSSIIMINQNEADKKRDAMMKKILQLEQKQLKEMKGETTHNGK